MTLRLIRIIAACVTAASLGVGPGAAQATDTAPPDLKAAFIFTFALFTKWPAGNPPGPVTVCVLGDPTVAEAFGRIKGDRQIDGRDATTVYLETARNLTACRVLYIGGDSARDSRVLDAVAGAPVLTIGDGEQFARLGGIAGLFMDGGRMRFAVNTSSVMRAGLVLSSRLLGLAKLYRDEHAGP